MNNLSNEIIHLSKVLEQQIPKGYHEIMAEYVRQNIAGAIYDLLTIAICITIVFLIVKTVLKSTNNKENSIFFENDYSTNPDINGLGFSAVIGAVIVSAIMLIVLVAAFLDIQTAIQHAVAPNYYLIKSFIK